MKCVNFTAGSIKREYSGTASAAPSPNGKAIPASPIVAESRALRLITAPSISRPIKKRGNWSENKKRRQRSLQKRTYQEQEQAKAYVRHQREEGS